jgi:hypothetical protein
MMELTNLEREVNPTTQQRGSPSLICQRIAQKSRSADFAGRHAGFATASRMHTEWKRLPRHLHLSPDGIVPSHIWYRVQALGKAAGSV